MSISLLTSLALALSWTPILSQWFIKRGAVTSESNSGEKSVEADATEDPDAMAAAEEKHLSGFFLRIVNFHEVWLRRALERPWLLVIFASCAGRSLVRLLHVFRIRPVAGDG